LKKRIAHLEWRQRRVEEENEFLFNENQKMKTSYSAALDQLAKQLVKVINFIKKHHIQGEAISPKVFWQKKSAIWGQK
jgi:hypothetical protein